MLWWWLWKEARQSSVYIEAVKDIRRLCLYSCKDTKVSYLAAIISVIKN
jgi:hypothetical protein